jgi:hypothetical protein
MPLPLTTELPSTIGAEPVDSIAAFDGGDAPHEPRCTSTRESGV